MTTEYRTAAASKSAGITYHLAIQQEWDAQKHGEGYVPDAYEVDGFIHCTNGLDLLTEVANMFYKGSGDLRVVLVLDVPRIDAAWRYDDELQTFPHLYGPLNPSAVIDELPVIRNEEGFFFYLGR